LSNKELNQFITENVSVTKEQLEQISIAIRNVIPSTKYTKHDIQQQIIQIGTKLEGFELKKINNNRTTVQTTPQNGGKEEKPNMQRFSYLVLPS